MSVTSSSGRHSCLIVLSSCKEGIFARHVLLGYEYVGLALPILGVLVYVTGGLGPTEFIYTYLCLFLFSFISRCGDQVLISASGVSAQSFIQCFTLTHSAFAVQLATPGVSSGQNSYEGQFHVSETSSLANLVAIVIFMI
jgi:hypothetical protein